MTSHFYENLDFPDSKEGRPFIACNMVSSLDGKVTSGGTLRPGSLGSVFDRHTMNVIRSHFDAVLAGGNTIRSHPYYLGVPKDFEKQRVGKGLASQPLTVLLTKSGSLDPQTPLFSNAPRPPLIITTNQGAKALPKSIKEQSTIEVIGGTEGLEAVSRLLWEKHNVNRLLIEGGPSINYQFLEAKLLDELFITLAPRLIGATEDLTMVMGEGVLKGPKQLTLLSSFQQGDELFLRYGLLW